MALSKRVVNCSVKETCLLDVNGRKKAAPILEPIASGLAKIGVTPAVVTVLGLAVTVVGAVLISLEYLFWGGLVAGTGVTLDALDGPLARKLGTSSERGAFLDTMSDRFGEIAVWIGVSVYLRDEPRLLVLCIVALAFSLLVPYVRAKAELAGLDGRGGWMGRGERMILLLIGLMAIGLGIDIMEPLLWVFVVLTSLTVAQRIRKTWQQLEA
ncbi:MAG: CDP-alcohol phosphatidyltransferase family protein [Acidobacteria bacterium]|nr:MAG: CDP-alcohol phosphatidyltransferase family protein [Acidobacteriota bacterium]